MSAGAAPDNPAPVAGGRSAAEGGTAGTQEGGPNAGLVARIHAELSRRIAEGILPAGERLVIDRLAREFGTSLIPVREALARLHAERLAGFERNRGYRVAPRPTVGDIRRLFEARLVLEAGAVGLGAASAPEGAIAELAAVNRDIAAGRWGTTFEGFRGFVDLNERFHLRLVALAENPFLEEAYRRLAYHQQILRPTHGRGVPDIAAIIAEHGAIIDALGRRDPEAARAAVEAHIRGGLTRLLNDAGAPE